MRRILLVIPSFFQILTLMAGEIFAMCPYSKVSKTGVGFFNQ